MNGKFGTLGVVLVNDLESGAGHVGIREAEVGRGVLGHSEVLSVKSACYAPASIRKWLARLLAVDHTTTSLAGKDQ